MKKGKNEARYSLDNLPNPEAEYDDPYRPTNGPAIGNLMTLFDFDRSRSQEGDTPLLPNSD
jgi:phospholipase C